MSSTYGTFLSVINSDGFCITIPLSVLFSLDRLDAKTVLTAAQALLQTLFIQILNHSI